MPRKPTTVREEDKKTSRLLVRLTPSLHHQLRIAAVTRQVTMEDFVAEAIRHQLRAGKAA